MTLKIRKIAVNIEETHREDAQRPNFESAHLYMGEEDDGAAHMSAALKAHVATELGREAAILKERRKAHEARDARAKPKSGPGANK